MACIQRTIRRLLFLRPTCQSQVRQFSCWLWSQERCNQLCRCGTASRLSSALRCCTPVKFRSRRFWAQVLGCVLPCEEECFLASGQRGWCHSCGWTTLLRGSAWCSWSTRTRPLFLCAALVNVLPWTWLGCSTPWRSSRRFLFRCNSKGTLSCRAPGPPGWCTLAGPGGAASLQTTWFYQCASWRISTAQKLVPKVSNSLTVLFLTFWTSVMTAVPRIYL